MTLLLRRAGRKTRYVGHRMMHTNRRLGSLNTPGGFGKLVQTFVLYGGRHIHTVPIHRHDHPSVRLRAAPYTRIGLPRWRYCYWFSVTTRLLQNSVSENFGFHVSLLHQQRRHQSYKLAVEYILL